MIVWSNPTNQTNNDTLSLRNHGFGCTMNILYGERTCGQGDIDDMNTIITHYLYYLDLMGLGREDAGPHDKFSEPFLCLIGMSRNYTLDEDTYPTFLRDDGTEMYLFAFIQVADPTNVKVGEWERTEVEAKLLDSTIGHVVSLLPVAPSRRESELEASVERLFDKGGSADQVDFAAGGGQEAKTGIATGVRIVADEKKLRGDHGASSEAAIGGKSPSALRKLLASSMLNVEVGVAVVSTLPMVTSSVSATPEHESGAPADSITGLNIRTIGASKRSTVIPPVMTEVVVTSYAVNIPPVLKMRVKVTSHVHASLFQDSNSTKTVKADTAGPSYSAKRDLSMGSRELNFKTMRQVFVSQWNVLNDSLFDDYDRIALARGRGWSLSVRNKLATKKMRDVEIEVVKQRNMSLKNEKESLDEEVAGLQSFISTKDLELKDLNVVLSSLRSQKDGLVDQVYALETTCFGLCDQLDADFLEMALHLEEKFYPTLLTTIFGSRWLLTHGLKLAVIKCLTSQEYLSALREAISRANEKVMQDGLSTGIDHGKEGRNLADIVAYNPAAEVDYNFALQRLHEVDFSLLFELKSHKDASVEDIINLLRLEGPLDDASGMSGLQPHTPLVDPLSVKNLMGEAGASDNVPATTTTTTALSTTFASVSFVTPITIEDYEIMGTDGPEDSQESGQGNVAYFPTVEFK
uniref:Chitinase-like protein 1 n=1 Tax=Tanacetum cinerariifolium TaxID=118510 RepID=A0A699HDI2_TANCI|nr:chitinase-like protein 1 [Tanacetum cinerariifolium]